MMAVWFSSHHSAGYTDAQIARWKADIFPLQPPWGGADGTFKFLEGVWNGVNASRINCQTWASNLPTFDPTNACFVLYCFFLGNSFFGELIHCHVSLRLNVTPPWPPALHNPCIRLLYNIGILMGDSDYCKRPDFHGRRNFIKFY